MGLRFGNFVGFDQRQDSLGLRANPIGNVGVVVDQIAERLRAIAIADLEVWLVFRGLVDRDRVL